MKENTGDIAGIGFFDFVIQYLFKTIDINALYFAYIDAYDVDPYYANANVIMSDEETKPINSYFTLLIKMPDGQFIDMSCPNETILSIKTGCCCRVVKYLEPFVNYCDQKTIPGGKLTGQKAGDIARSKYQEFEKNRILALVNKS